MLAWKAHCGLSKSRRPGHRYLTTCTPGQPIHEWRHSAMDSTLLCNDLKCRSLCPDQAVVTTCSHIFCIPCAGRLGLTEPRDGQRICPACSTHLVNPDDAVITSLNPTEDYKTSILSGLSPTIIMECAGRGLAFWAYQMVQEMWESRKVWDDEISADAMAVPFKTIWLAALPKGTHFLIRSALSRIVR